MFVAPCASHPVLIVCRVCHHLSPLSALVAWVLALLFKQSAGVKSAYKHRVHVALFERAASRRLLSYLLTLVVLFVLGASDTDSFVLALLPMHDYRPS